MFITPELIKQISTRHGKLIPADQRQLSLDEYIAMALNDISRTENLLSEALKARKEAEVKSEQILQEAYSLLREARQQCPHYDIERHPDASGNNDVTYRCRICSRDVGAKQYKANQV